MVQGVIFDMDGLMFDTEPIWGSCWEPVLAKFGIEVPEGLVEDVRGCAGDTMLATLRRYFGNHAPVEQIWQAEKDMGQELILAGVPKKPGLDDLLEYLRGLMLPLAVASSSPMHIIEANLSNAGIRHYFDVVVSGEALGRGKPDPLIYFETAELLGTDPGKTVVLEDSFNGVRAGHAGGFVTVMVPDLLPPTDEIRSMATAVVGDLGEVIDFLECHDFS